jgi:hypothetical protein
MTGNGGDIRISANTLYMRTGFIQANTAAPNASGGEVGIDVQLLIATGGSLMVGGDAAYNFQPGVFGLNVIQAAAPTGVSGAVRLASPALDVAGTLIGLNTRTIDMSGFGRDPCRPSSGSSLIQTGRGGFAPLSRDLMVPVRVSFDSTDAQQAFTYHPDLMSTVCFYHE